MSTTFLSKKNNAASTISNVGGITAGATSVSIQAGDTGLFPSSGNFEVTLWPAGQNPTQANSEIVLVTSGQGSQTFTITRSQEGTSAKSFAQNDNIALLSTAKFFADIETQVQNVQTELADLGNYVHSGLTVPTSANLTTTIAAGSAYYGGVQYSIASDGGHAYTASKDTYVDVNPATGAYTYTAVSNGSTAPSLTASSIRIAKVVTGGSAVTSTTQYGEDGIGNLIYPNRPSPTYTEFVLERGDFSSYIHYGLTVPTSGSLSTTISSGIVFFQGQYYSVASDGGHAYTASKDTYVDLNPATGTYTYTAVTNGAAAPSLTSGTIRIGKVVSGASTISSTVQDGSIDSIGNVIYPSNPQVLGVNYYTPAAAGTCTLSFSNNYSKYVTRHIIQMPAGNITIALPTGVPIPSVFIVEIIQDGTGSRTVTWFSTIDWTPNDTAPTLTTTANKKDTFGFLSRVTGTYDGYVIGQGA